MNRLTSWIPSRFRAGRRGGSWSAPRYSRCGFGAASAVRKADAWGTALLRLVEAGLDELTDRVERLGRLRAARRDGDLAPLLGREHHHPHDAPPVHDLTVLRDAHLDRKSVV